MSEKISITKDAMKAEAKIRRIRSSAGIAYIRSSEKYGAMETAYVDTLTPEVRRVLLAAGVLSAEAPSYSVVDGIFEGSGEEVPLAEVLHALGETDVEGL